MIEDYLADAEQEDDGEDGENELWDDDDDSERKDPGEPWRALAAVAVVFLLAYMATGTGATSNLQSQIGTSAGGSL